MVTQFEKTFCPYGSFMACQFIVRGETAGGLYVPDMSKGEGLPASTGEVQKAKVIAIGPEVKYYKPGDIVLVRTGAYLQHKGQKFALLLEEETFGCENRDLEQLPADERADAVLTKRLKIMIFEQASEIIAGMVNTVGNMNKGSFKPR